jgi:hypothetical protein
MSAQRIFAIVFLGLCLSGCSGYQRGTISNTSSTNSEFGTDVQVNRGSNVRIKLHSGEIISGEVIQFSEKEIVVAQLAGDPAHNRIVDVSGIASLEVKENTSSKTILFASVVGAALVYAIVLAFKGWTLY